MALLQRVGSRSPGSFGVGPEGGRAVEQYVVANTGSDDLQGDILSIIGYTERLPSGRLGRGLPKAHPLMPWLYASRITNIVGIGRAAGTEAAAPQLEVEPITSAAASYPYYELTVEFTPRMYAVFKDDWVETESMTYYLSDNSSATKTIRREWTRYTDYEILPAPELITAQQGQSFFVTSTGAISPYSAASPPHSFPFQGFPRIVSPRSSVVFRWFQVPFGYVDSENSYLDQHIGKINQKPWYGWPAGSLLYEGFKAKRYVPSVPDLVQEEDTSQFSTDKLCDIEFAFTYVRRTQSSVPDFSAINRSWVAAGHNLLPWFGDRQYYHAVYPSQSALNTTSGWKPTYESFPFQLLFQDPDAP